MKKPNRIHPYEGALAAVVLVAHLYAALSDAYNLPNTWFIRDDAYYYFKVAQNITEGLGSSFDGINRTNGYHPLWLVVCIPVFALARFDLILPLRVLLVIMGLFNAATGILIYRLLRRDLSHAVAILASAFWCFSLYIHYVVYKYGLETPLAAFLLVLFIDRLSGFERNWREHRVGFRDLGGLALLGTLLMFSRLDLVFFAASAGIWIVFRGTRIRYLLPLDAATIFLSLTASAAFLTGVKVYNAQYAQATIGFLVLALPLKLAALYLFGNYQPAGPQPVWITVRRLLPAMSAATLLLLGAALADIGIFSFPGRALALDLFLSTSLLLALRLGALWFEEQGRTAADPANPIQVLRANLRTWAAEAGIYYGILGGILAVYMAANQLFFGTATPVSGQIKRWWGTLGNTVYDYPAGNWFAFLGISHKGVYDAWKPASLLFDWLAIRAKPLYPGSNTQDERYYAIMGILLAASLILLFLRGRNSAAALTRLAIPPLLAGCAIHVLSYTATAYGGAKEWYWVGQSILVVLAGSLLLDLILKPLQGYRYFRFILEAGSVAAGIYLAAGFGVYVRTAMPYGYFPPDRPYMEVLPFIEANTPPGSAIGMTGGGNVGYFIRGRTIVNMDGLINSHEYFQAVQEGRAPMFLKQRGLDVVFANTRLMEQPPYFGQFTPYLQSYNSYGGKDLFYLLEAPKY